MNPNGPFFGKQLWMRIDGDGNAIAGTSVWRKRKPVNGLWKLVPSPNLCCNSVPGSVGLDATVADLSNATYVVTILCNAVAKIATTFTILTATVTLADVVAALNQISGGLGHFSSSGTAVVHLELNPAIADAICTGTLTMTVAAA